MQANSGPHRHLLSLVARKPVLTIMVIGVIALFSFGLLLGDVVQVLCGFDFPRPVTLLSFHAQNQLNRKLLHPR
jgi:hypothetical protein